MSCMLCLLDSSLERIDSLQNYYQQELSSIKRRVNKGLKENRFGYLMDYYFSVLTSNDQDAMKKDSFKSLQKYAEQHISIVQIESSRVVFELKNIDYLKHLKINTNIVDAARLYRQYKDMSIIHANNTLIMLIVRFEEFLSNVFRILYNMFPAKYLDGQAITYSEIQNRDLNEVRKTIVDREIENLMRDSYTRWFKLLQSHKIKLDVCKLQLEVLDEIYARRNIIVHNSCHVNETYLKNSCNKDVKIGDYLSVDEKYISAAFDCIKTIIYSIVIQSSKLFKDEPDYLKVVFRKAFSELKAKNYAVSRKAFELLMNHPFLSDEYKNMSKVNYWIASMEIDTSVQSEIDQFDVSALEKRFKIAKLILQRKYDEATVLLDEEILYNNITPDMLEWPLYAHYIQTSEFESLRKKHTLFFDQSIADIDGQRPDNIKVSGSSIREDVEESRTEETKQ